MCLSVCLGMKMAKRPLLDVLFCTHTHTQLVLHTYTHTLIYTYISVNGSCQHDSYKDNTNVTDVCRAGNEMLSLGNTKVGGTEYLLNLIQKLMR